MAVVAAGAVLLLLVAATAAIASGRGFPVTRLGTALADPASAEGQILRLVRAPRMVTAAIAGAGLAVAGMILQTVLRNPLAAPELTGVNSTAVLGVVTALAVGWVAPDAALGPLLAALVGGLLGGLLSWLVVGGRHADRLLMVGIVVAALAGGVTVLLLTIRANAFSSVARWLVGSVDARTWHHLAFAAPWVGGWILVAWALSGWLVLLAPGDGHARAVGVPVAVARSLLLVTAVFLVAGVTAVAGGLSFIGLAVPHLTRAALGNLRRWSAVPVAAALGAALMLGCDAVAQGVTGLLARADVSQKLGIPAGAVAAVLAAVALGVIARKESTDHG